MTRLPLLESTSKEVGWLTKSHSAVSFPASSSSWEEERMSREKNRSSYLPADLPLGRTRTLRLRPENFLNIWMKVDFIGRSGLPIYKKDILFSCILCIEFIQVLIRRPQKEPRRGNFEVRQGTKIACQMDFWELGISALCPKPKAGKWWNFCLGIKSIYGYMTQKRIFWSTNIFFL